MSSKADLIFTAFSLPQLHFSRNLSFLKGETYQVPGELGFLFSEDGNILSLGGRASALTECVSGVRSCLGSGFFFFFHFVRLQRETYSVYKCEYRNIKILRAYSYQMMSPGSAQFADFKFYPCFH